jgi:NAD-dependent deacetylase
MDRITTALKKADLFVCIGTSGVVYPAAGFAAQAAGNGRCRLIEVNMDRTGISQHFHQHITGPAAVEVPKLVDAILAEASLSGLESD